MNVMNVMAVMPMHSQWLWSWLIPLYASLLDSGKLGGFDYMIYVFLFADVAYTIISADMSSIRWEMQGQINSKSVILMSLGMALLNCLLHRQRQHRTSKT